MAVKSLVDLCLRVALDNLSRIDSLANMPLKAVQELLSGVRSAAQLRAFEVNDEEIREVTAPHWQRLIHKDFPLLEKQYNWVPKRPEDWHKVYEKYRKLQAEQDAEATAKLQAAFAARKKEADRRQASLVSFKDTWKLPRLPKDGGSSFGGFRPPPWGSSSSSSGSGSGARRKEGKGFLQKARREARDLHNRHVSSISSGRATGQIARAPQAMVEAKRIERQYDPSAAHVNAPTIRTARALGAKNDQEDRLRKEREARLLSIKTGGSAVAGNVISFDDDDMEDENDDDLFGGKKAEAGRAGRAYSPPSSPDFASTTPKKPGVKRRQGFLSASPGANAGSGTVRTIKDRSLDLSTPSGPNSSSLPSRISSDISPTKTTAAPRPTVLSSKLAAESRVSHNAGVQSSDAPEDDETLSTLTAADRAAFKRLKRKPAAAALFVPKKRPRM